MKRLVLIGLVLTGILAATGATAQTPFALSNLGQKIETGDARMAGRGGWGMAVRDSVNPGFKNLAGLSAIRQVAVSLSGYGVGTDSEDAAGTRSVTRVMAPDFRLAAPVMKGQLAVTAGFRMDRSFRYDTSHVLTSYVRGDTLRGFEEFHRRGTIFSVPLGVAWEALPGLSLGASVNLVRGSVSESLYEIFLSPATSTGSPFYQPVQQIQKDTFEGTSSTWSALYRWSDRVSVGVSYTPAYDIDADRLRTINGLTARWTQPWKMRMPDEIQTGLQARVIGRWWVGADYSVQAFSEFEGPQKWLDEGMEDETRLSLGVERMLGHQRRGGSSNWPVRFGFAQHRWAYRVGGEPIDESIWSAGTGFPFSGRLGVLDLALSYSKVGDLEKNGLEDSVWKMAVTVTGLERWW